MKAEHTALLDREHRIKARSIALYRQKWQDTGDQYARHIAIKLSLEIYGRYEDDMEVIQ